MMPGEERLLNEGRLREAEQRAQHLAIAITGLRESVRRLTDPHRPIEQLDLDALRVALDELVEKNAAYTALIQHIAALRADLGLPRYEAR